jgi:phenylpyruvate tautomerase PptA (4-oxalocrotonate tautomerase family)
MPLVRIDIAKSASPQVVRAVSDVVYDAMTSVASVPSNDRFQIITRHGDDELVYPEEGYLSVTYSPGIVFVQVTWNSGRSVEVKKAFYREVAGGIAHKAGIRIQDVWISLIDVAREDWSFGNGDMQYAPKDS